MGLISLAKVEEAKERAERGKLAAQTGLQGADLPDDADTKSGVRLIDANLVHKAAKQAKRSKRSGGIGQPCCDPGKAASRPPTRHHVEQGQNLHGHCSGRAGNHHRVCHHRHLRNPTRTRFVQRPEFRDDRG